MTLTASSIDIEDDTVPISSIIAAIGGLLTTLATWKLKTGGEGFPEIMAMAAKMMELPVTREVLSVSELIAYMKAHNMPEAGIQFVSRLSGRSVVSATVGAGTN